MVIMCESTKEIATMKRSTEIITVTGADFDSIKWKQQYHHVTQLYSNRKEKVAVYKCWKYFDEEIEEIMIYGDPSEDEYSMSDSHRADCQQEQWDWIKNEMS